MTRGAQATRIVTTLLTGASVPNDLLDGWRAVRGDQAALIAFGAVQLIAGVAAAIALVLVWRAPRAAWPWLVAWALASVVLGSTAARLFGDAPVSVSIAGGVASAAVLGAILALWRVTVHRRLDA